MLKVKEHGLKRISVPSLYKGTIDRVWILLKRDGYSCLKTGPWQCSAYTSINHSRCALKDDCANFSTGPVRKLKQTFKTCNEMSKLITIDETMAEQCNVSCCMEFNWKCCVDENNSMYLTKGWHSIGTMPNCIDNKLIQKIKWIEEHQTANHS